MTTIYMDSGWGSCEMEGLPGSRSNPLPSEVRILEGAVQEFQSCLFESRGTMMLVGRMMVSNREEGHETKISP
jgi:hypothetical protein